MDRLKTFRKYIIWIIAFFLFSTLISYIGLNAKYKNIESTGEMPGGVKINLSQATSVNDANLSSASGLKSRVEDVTGVAGTPNKKKDENEGKNGEALQDDDGYEYSEPVLYDGNPIELNILEEEQPEL